MLLLHATKHFLLLQLPLLFSGKTGPSNQSQHHPPHCYFFRKLSRRGELVFLPLSNSSCGDPPDGAATQERLRGSAKKLCRLPASADDPTTFHTDGLGSRHGCLHRCGTWSIAVRESFNTSSTLKCESCKCFTLQR